MSADAGGQAPFKPLPYKAPDIEVTQGKGGIVYLRSRTPPAPAARSIPHILDERAAMHPDRVWLKQRKPDHGPWREVPYGKASQDDAGAGAGPARSRARARCAVVDPVGQLHRARADVAGGPADRGSRDADLAGVFDDVERLRQAEALLQCGEAEGDLRADDGPFPQGAGSPGPYRRRPSFRRTARKAQNPIST